jgi:hypothetical protein
MNDKFDPATYKRVTLHCRTRFLADGDIWIEAAEYEGYTINTIDGEQKTFLLLPPGPSQIDVTYQANKARLIIFSC